MGAYTREHNENEIQKYFNHGKFGLFGSGVYALRTTIIMLQLEKCRNVCNGGSTFEENEPNVSNFP